MCYTWDHLKFSVNFVYRGLLTRSGPFFTEKDYPDLTNKKWLVTGATGGIGLEISKALVRLNAELWIVGRSTSKLESAAVTLRKENPQAVVHIINIDFSDLRTVKPAVELIKSQTNFLNGIIHNAGVMNVPVGSITEQGIESSVGVNNCAPQLLQDLLDPLIVDTPDARLVWVSSIGHTMAPRHGFSTKLLANGDNTSVLYGMSKAVNIIQSVQWSLKHPEATSVKSLSVHPGVVRSDIFRSTDAGLQTTLYRWLAYDAPYGAFSPIYAALSPDAVNNDYIIPFGRPGPVRPDIYAAARNEYGEATMAWIEGKIKGYT